MFHLMSCLLSLSGLKKMNCGKGLDEVRWMSPGRARLKRTLERSFGGSGCRGAARGWKGEACCSHPIAQKEGWVT
jgi:hypothetical protein